MREILKLYIFGAEYKHVIIDLLTFGELNKVLFGINNKSIYCDGNWYLSDFKHEIFYKWKKLIRRQIAWDSFMKYCSDIYEKRNNIFGIDGKNYMNLHENTLFIKGRKNSLIINDVKRKAYHIDNKMSDIILKYCINNESIDKKSLNSLDIKVLVNMGIVEISNKKKLNIEFSNIKHSYHEINNVEIDLLNKCNQKCKHCYNDEFSKQPLEIIDYYIYIKMLKDLKIYGLSSVSLLGGEPTLLDNDDLLQFIHEIFMLEHIKNIHIFTNCSKLDEDLIIKLAEYKEKLIINITLHSNHQEKNDLISQSKGDFQKKIESIFLLKKHNIMNKISTIYTHDNIADFDEIEKFKGKMQDNYTSINSSLIRISEMMKHSLFSDKVHNFLLDPIRDINFFEYDISKMLQRRGINACFSSHLVFASNNDIYLCCQNRTNRNRIGNFIEDFKCNIDNIISSTQYQTSIAQRHEDNKCIICEFNTLCTKCSTLFINKSLYNVESFCVYSP